MRKFAVGVAMMASVVLTFAQSALGNPGAEKTLEQQLSELNWLAPGSVGRVADKAEFKVTDGNTFLGSADTDKFLKINGNLPRGNSYTVASVNANWFGILDFVDDGYVKDDEKIDADELLSSLKEGNIQANEERRKQGYPALTLEGWFFPPRYDTATKRLEWGTKLRSEQDQSLIVNVSTKILGRSGYTSAILVTEPATMEQDLLDFKAALKHFDYVSGEKYSEWKEGDKVAAYGLGALVLGGAAAAATSKGGIKAVGIAILAGLAALWAGIKRFFGRKA